jgi:hypothetical protein
MKPTPDGITIYDGGGARDVKIPADRFLASRPSVIRELAGAIACGTPARRNGPWGRVGLQSALAIQQSAAERWQVVF